MLGNLCVWEYAYVCVCWHPVHMEGVGVAVCKEKEQIDGAEREMHFSNITLSCHPLRLEKEQRENIFGGGKRKSKVDQSYVAFAWHVRK